MSSQPAELPVGLTAEPPVSLPATEESDAASAETAPMPARPPLEAALVQQGKLSMGQLAQAHRDRLEKGGSVLDIVVERGWVSAEEVAHLRAEHGIDIPAPAPAPAPAAEAELPAPVPVPAPTPVPAPQPVPPAAAYRVAIRLTNDELIVTGEVDDSEKAEALALAVVADVTTEGAAWPRFQGRYLRPETIVSVDILPA